MYKTLLSSGLPRISLIQHKSLSQTATPQLSEESQSELRVGIPQGSVLGPRSFIVYAEDATDIFMRHRVHHQIFADDMQATKPAKPSQVSNVAAELGSCMSAVNDWCTSKRPQLNTMKTQVMWDGSTTNLSKLSHGDKLIKTGSDTLQPTDQVRDLGVCFDSELNMKLRSRELPMRVTIICGGYGLYAVCLVRQSQLVLYWHLSSHDWIIAMLSSPGCQRRL